MSATIQSKTDGMRRSEHVDKKNWAGHSLTGNCLRMSPTLPTSNEDNIPLAGAHIVALQEEEFVDPVVLKRSDLDDVSNRASEALLNYEVLLSLDLEDAGVQGQLSCYVKQAGLPLLTTDSK